jgi:glycine/D-amino acid oxidase-like deaminating enzyme
MAGLYEPRAGYLRVEACVAAHLAEAQRWGAELRTDEPALSWRAEGSGVSVETSRARYSASRLVIAAGPWAAALLTDIAVPLEVRRKHQYWFGSGAPAYRTDRGCPAYLFELPQGIFYGFPHIDDWGVKVARHTGGDAVADPLHVNREVDPADLRLVQEFLTAHLTGVEPRLLHHSVCMYTMSPDEHFLVDSHPSYPQVAFVAGLSGHGFKFTCVLGEALADLALAGETSLPIHFLNCRRLGLRRAK